MPNTYKNKVVFNGQTLIDLTADTVTPSTLMQGYTAHDRSGATIVGTATGGDYEIAVDSMSMVGSVEAGTAVTASPNYTPSGDIRLEAETVAVPTGIELNYSYSNYVLTIAGVSMTAQQVSVPKSVTFHGSPVRLVAERSDQ